MERPCLFGPRNETFEGNVYSSRESVEEAIQRKSWRESDGKIFTSSEESRDDEDIGLCGELCNETVGIFKETRSKDQVYEKEAKVADSRDDMNALIQLAAISVHNMSKRPTNAGCASFPHTTTTIPIGQKARSTQSRIRARDSEDNAEDQNSPLQRKRMHMDDMSGTARSDANSRASPKEVSAAMKPTEKGARGLEDNAEERVTQSTRKRLRLFVRAKDGAEGGTSKPKRVRLHLYQRAKEIRDDNAQHIAADQANVTNNDNSMLICQDTSSREGPEDSVVEKDETPNNEKEALDEETLVEDGPGPTRTEWDTAHGINSKGANIRIPGRMVHDVAGDFRPLYLPTPTGLRDRLWTEEDKEDLRVYNQDHGIQDWARLSRSTRRPRNELQKMYLEIVTARNRQARRPICAGIPDEYPQRRPVRTLPPRQCKREFKLCT